MFNFRPDATPGVENLRRSTHARPVQNLPISLAAPALGAARTGHCGRRAVVAQPSARRARLQNRNPQSGAKRGGHRLCDHPVQGAGGERNHRHRGETAGRSRRACQGRAGVAGTASRPDLGPARPGAGGAAPAG